MELQWQANTVPMLNIVLPDGVTAISCNTGDGADGEGHGPADTHRVQHQA